MCHDKVLATSLHPLMIIVTIKALRSDRGGEYISQEFKDYLKACEIVQQLTPPYTPQHSGMSERRNRTLLDMVRSMMNLTTLPLSFWDYALESETRILNMVQTKKVDKTPYKLWYGKVPNLSYLKVWGCEIPILKSVKDYLRKCFAMKDLGEAAFILGIKIYRDRLNLNKTRGASTPKEVKRMQNVPYASAAGFIINPEAELRVDCYCDAGFETDRDEIKSQTGYVFILNGRRNRLEKLQVKYYYDNLEDPFTKALPKGKLTQHARSMGLRLASSFINPEAKLRVDCCCNARFEIDRDEIKSQTGYVFILNGRRKMEAVWIRKFISKLGIVPTINELIKMFYDNSVALLIANESRVQRGVIHYHKRYQYICECIELGKINLLKVHTDDNLEDPFTKDLPKGKLTQHARSM
nr:retrotransposon protein, putative, Ty1-copia subclass [Tanacetum cinerariifolium]